MIDGSKYVDWCKEVPFVCLNYARPILGVVSPKNYTKIASDSEIPAKWIKSNNFQSVQDSHKMSMQHEYKVRVALSKSVMKNHLRCPLADITL